MKNIGRAVQRMASADLLRELQRPDLLPGLFEAFDHHSADVRKAVTMCLMHMWQVGTQLSLLSVAAPVKRLFYSLPHLQCAAMFSAGADRPACKGVL